MEMHELIATQDDLFFVGDLDAEGSIVSQEGKAIDMGVVKRLLLDGFSERYIRSVLDVDAATWKALKKKYPRFETLVENWVLADKEGIAVSMKQRAKGLRYTERKRAPVEQYNPDTGQMERKMVVVEEVEKFALPDTGAGKFLLTNLDGENFKDRQVHEVHTSNSYEQELLAARKRLAKGMQVEVLEDEKPKAVAVPEKKALPPAETPPSKKKKNKAVVVDAIGLEGLL